MLHFEIQVYGARAVANELRTAAAGMQRRVTNATYAWAQSRVVSQLSVMTYPPKRPGQRYVRTYRLRNGWTVTAKGKGVTIANRMPYAGYVMGDARGQRQAWMHRGRWPLVKTIIDKERPRLKAGIEDEVQRAFPRWRRTW